MRAYAGASTHLVGVRCWCCGSTQLITMLITSFRRLVWRWGSLVSNNSALCWTMRECLPTGLGAVRGATSARVGATDLPKAELLNERAMFPRLSLSDKFKRITGHV